MSPSFPYLPEPLHGDLGRTLRAWAVGIMLGGTLLGLNISCGGGHGNTSEPPPPPPTTGMVSGKVKNYISGQAISGATVTDGQVTTTTHADGSYTLIVSPSGRKQITITASNFGETQRIASVLVGGTSQVNADLLPATITDIPDLTTGATITVPGTPAQVILPANGLVAPGGGVPSFPVKASLTPVDPTSNPALMPGDYSTNTGEQIESFGALQATFTDSKGARLNLAAGQTATLRIPLASFHWGGTPPATMPAFYFDEAGGRWVKEGTLTLGGADLDQYYEGTVAHFSTWNADIANATTCITGTVVRKDGTTVVPGATVTATGADYVGTYVAISAADGTFTLYVKANATSVVTANALTVGGIPIASSAPGISMTVTTGTTCASIPAGVLNSNPAGKIIVDGFLNLEGTMRDFSPSAPWQFPYALTTNGTFDSDTGWNKGTGWSIAAGKATCAAHGTSTSDLSQNQLVTSGQTYPVTFTITRTSASGSITPMLGGTSGTARSASGTYTQNIACGAGVDPKLVFRADAAFLGTIDNIQVGDGHPPSVTIDANTPFPIYNRTGGDALLALSDGPWWNPDFEMSNSWMGAFTGIVDVQLGANNKPVFTGKPWNQGGVHSAASFNAWWTDFPSPHGTKDAQPYQGSYTIPLSEVLPSTNPPTYMYDNQAQFPNDGIYQGNYIYNNTGTTSGARGTAATAPEDGKPHNFHYTYELHTTFTYKPGQVFSFIGDDDVWVFINKKLVIDLGGVHSSLSGSVTLDASTVDKAGNPMNLVDGLVYQFDFFYCERHTTQSHMKITTSLALNGTIPK